MTRLIRLAGAGVFLFSAVIFLARFAGLHQPVTFGGLFTNPDGTPCQPPCLFGVRPGETRIEDALRLLHEHPLTTDLQVQSPPGAANIQLVGDGVCLGLNRTAGGEVTLVFLELAPGCTSTASAGAGARLRSLTVGQVMATVDAPRYVLQSDDFRPNFNYGVTRTYYPPYRMTVVEWRKGRPFVSLNDPLLYLFMYARPITVDPSMVGWQGFTMAVRYLPSNERH